MKKLDNPKNATINHLIEAIKFKLTTSFESKRGLNII